MKWKLLSIPLFSARLCLPITHMIRTQKTQLILIVSKNNPRNGRKTPTLRGVSESVRKVRRCRHSHESLPVKYFDRPPEKKLTEISLQFAHHRAEKKKLKLNFVSTRMKTTLKFDDDISHLCTHLITFSIFFQHSPLAPHIDVVISTGNVRRRWRISDSCNWICYTDQNMFCLLLPVQKSERNQTNDEAGTVRALIRCESEWAKAVKKKLFSELWKLREILKLFQAFNARLVWEGRVSSPSSSLLTLLMCLNFSPHAYA